MAVLHRYNYFCATPNTLTLKSRLLLIDRKVFILGYLQSSLFFCSKTLSCVYEGAGLVLIRLVIFMGIEVIRVTKYLKS